MKFIIYFSGKCGQIFILGIAVGFVLPWILEILTGDPPDMGQRILFTKYFGYGAVINGSIAAVLRARMLKSKQDISQSYSIADAGREMAERRFGKEEWVARGYVIFGVVTAFLAAITLGLFFSSIVG